MAINNLRTQYYTENDGAGNAGADSGLALPSGWESYSPQAKISWFNANGVTPDQLLQMGVPQADIAWMSQNGYLGGGSNALAAGAIAGGSALDRLRAQNPNLIVQEIRSQPASPETGEGPGPLEGYAVYDPTKTAAGANKFTRFGPDGELIGEQSFKTPGNIVDLSTQFAKDMTPLAAAALGANALGAGLGQASIFGPGTAGSLTSGVTPTSVAAAEAGLPSALPNALASAPLTTTLAPAATEFGSTILPTANLVAPSITAPAAAVAPVAAVTTAPVAPAASAATETATAGLSSADKAALYGNAGYGPGMTGAQTGAYDTIIGATGSPALANVAAGVTGAGQSALSALVPAAAGATAASPFAAIIPAAASLIGAGVTSSAAKDAAQVTADAAIRAAQLQSDAANRALALQERMYTEGVARQQPYYQAGTNALAQMQGLTNAMPAAFQYTGQQPAAFQFRPEDLQLDPGYGFRLKEGLKALESSAAARGGLLSGGTGKALQRYGQDMASQEFGNAFNRSLTQYNAATQREQEQYGRALTGYNAATAREAQQYNRLAGLAGIGGTTAQQLTSAGQNYGSQAGNLMSNTATNLSNLAMQQGQTAAQAGMAGGAAWQRGLGDVASIYARMYGPQPTYNYLVPPGG